MEIKDYVEFMYNPDNAYKCSKCPENSGHQIGWGGSIGPCGQQHCWVDVHCNRDRYERRW